MSESETRCLRCGRRLSAQTSITARMGSTCQRKAGIALAEFSDNQIVKATELLEDEAITRARKSSPVYVAVSTDGSRTYLVGPRGCTCPRGRRDAARSEAAHCYHRAARNVLAA